MVEERGRTGLKFRVGTFVLIALLVFLGIIYLLGARSRLFEAKHTLYTEFNEVGGLVEGATVRLAGVQIGRVAAIALPSEPGGKVRVELRVGRQFANRVRKNSIARIDTQGLLGDKIVEITVGASSEPAVESGGTIASREPADIAQVISESAQVVKNVAIITESLRTTAESLNQSKIIEDVGAVTGAARRVAQEVEKGSGWLNALVYGDASALKRLDQVVASTQGVVARVERSDIVGNLASLSDTLRKTADQLNQTKTLENLGAAAEGARTVVETFSRSTIAQDLGAAAASVRRVTEQVEKGPGLVHALLYDEPAALRKLDTLLDSTQAILDRAARGEGAVGVLTSAESGQSARRLVAAMDRLARAVDGTAGDDQGLVPALLFDPRYKAVAEDVRAIARNLREVSDRVVGGKGTLGGLVKDEPGQAPGLGQITTDLGVAMANLKEITTKVNTGEGTLGALIADPTLYENLSSILDGASRSFLLRTLLRGLSNKGGNSTEKGQ